MRKRYPSDLTDQQWARISPIFEGTCRGRLRVVPVRDIVSGIRYVMKNGCPWRALPHDMPRWQTVFVQRLRWTKEGLLCRAFARLRPPGYAPSVGIIDSMFIESAYGGAQCAPNGYKRATGHGIHVLIDKRSRPLAFAVLPGNLQDAAGARRLIPDAKRRHPSLRVVFGDKAYRQRPLREEMAALSVAVDGDSPPLPKGTIFRPMPMRWRIEQFFAWLCKWRRIAVLRAYQATACAVGAGQWRLLQQKGRFDRNAKLFVTTKLSARYVQTCQYQVVSAFDSYLSSAHGHDGAPHGGLPGEYLVMSVSEFRGEVLLSLHDCDNGLAQRRWPVEQRAEAEALLEEMKQLAPFTM